jgi:AbrB family looped-hinge helix DNA binding protein
MHKPQFLGIGTVGERGQVSIPADARKLCDIAPGQKLVFLGMEDRGIVLVKADRLEAMFAEMSSHAEKIHHLISEAEKNV